jgi:cAMP-specific phosphodiesterase 4
MEETFVTPFAQILATMHKVRQNFVHLMNLPEDTHRHFHHKPLTPNPLSRKPPLTPFDRKLSLDAIRQHAVATLEQIDWCLQQLEGVDSAKAMGGQLAQDKFHRLLSSKLSNMSEHSKSGHQLAEWVQDITRSTNERNQQVDRALSQDTGGKTDMQPPRLSASMSHDVWRKRAMVRSSTGTQIQLLSEDSETVPTFGVTNSKMNAPQMRKFMQEEVGLWSPDVFRLDIISAGNSLVCAAYNIFKTRQFSCLFKISPPTFINFILAIQNRYRSTNPYHNHIHAADVLLTTDTLLKAKPLEVTIILLCMYAIPLQIKLQSV